jgi:3-deoxy-7-phosphoheptulonate synthase/chorismate mutase
MMTKNEKTLKDLREKMSAINDDLLVSLNRFFSISNQIGQVKDAMGLPHFDPVREFEMLKEILSKNRGPMPTSIMQKIFKEIFKASVEEMGSGSRRKLNVSRYSGKGGKIIDLNGILIGAGHPVIISGPCAVESSEQLRATATYLKHLGIHLLRGGAFKPRTSPYSFQGLEEDALKMLKALATELDMRVVTEVLTPEDIPLVEKYADILQIGSRNMYNYSLLKRIGKIHKPVLLKRGFMATIDEFILAAEYIYNGGNEQIILCERGIRTFETQTRNTLDISAIPILKMETSLPVIVDISHSLGRKDIVFPIAHASLAAGADGLMFESHFNPPSALCDSHQQLDPCETETLVESLKKFHTFDIYPSKPCSGVS